MVTYRQVRDDVHWIVWLPCTNRGNNKMIFIFCRFVSVSFANNSPSNSQQGHPLLKPALNYPINPVFPSLLPPTQPNSGSETNGQPKRDDDKTSPTATESERAGHNDDSYAQVGKLTNAITFFPKT